MPILLEKYTSAIASASNYNELATAVDECLNLNVFGVTSNEIRLAIDKLDLNSDFHNFIMSLLWAVHSGVYATNALTLLKHLCDKISTNIDNISMPISNISLMTVLICAKDKSFVKRLTVEQKDIIINEICINELVINQKDSPLILMDLFRESIDLILDGKTLQELDEHFQETYNNLMNLYKGDREYVNEGVRPFQVLFMNIIQDMDTEDNLEHILTFTWRNGLNSAIEEFTDNYVSNISKFMIDTYNSGYIKKQKTDEDIKRVLKDETLANIYNFLSIFKSYNDSFIKAGCPGVTYNSANDLYAIEITPSDSTGLLIIELLNQYHFLRTFINDFNYINMLVIEVKDLLGKYFSMNEYVKNNLNYIIADICKNTEDILLSDKYMKCVKMYLDKDEAFKLIATDLYFDCELNHLSNSQYRVYITYLNKYYDTSLVNVIRDLSEVATEGTTNPKPIDATQSTKGYKKSSVNQAERERKIYKSYKNYKDNEAQIDSQLSKMVVSMKNAFSQDKTEEIIEGKKFSAIGILKKVLATAAIFSFSKVAAIVYLVASFAISKKRTAKQKQDIIIQLESEIRLIDEKLDDARSDGNRQAKYALIRTKGELERARDRIRYNLSANKADVEAAKKYIRTQNSSREG